MLITIPDLLTATEVASARGLLQHADWHNGSATAGAQAAQVKNNQQLSAVAAPLPALRNMVLDALNRSATFLTAALPLKIWPPDFNRYQGDANAYGFHVDSAIRHIPSHQGGTLRSDLSATLFLSEPDDYDGGVLTIQDTFGNHGVRCPAGTLVLYPSSSVHAVTPVTRGTRLACFLFIQSMVRDAAQRRILYDMDMALLQLRNSVGDTAPVVQLTGTYHNLLRCWAET
jgi:PKHD-type hydroxylase